MVERNENQGGNQGTPGKATPDQGGKPAGQPSQPQKGKEGDKQPSAPQKVNR